MPIGVPRIIYCWGEELPAQWTDIYNFVFRRRTIFLMQYLDDELCNQICGLLINIHMEDRSKELEQKEMEKSGLFKRASSSKSSNSSLSNQPLSTTKKKDTKNASGFSSSKTEKSVQDLLISEQDLAIDENDTLEQYTLQKISMDWLNWNAQFFDYGGNTAVKTDSSVNSAKDKKFSEKNNKQSNLEINAEEPYLFYLAEILSKDFNKQNPSLLYKTGKKEISNVMKMFKYIPGLKNSSFLSKSNQNGSMPAKLEKGVSGEPINTSVLNKKIENSITSLAEEKAYTKKASQYIAPLDVYSPFRVIARFAYDNFSLRTLRPNFNISKKSDSTFLDASFWSPKETGPSAAFSYQSNKNTLVKENQSVFSTEKRAKTKAIKTILGTQHFAAKSKNYEKQIEASEKAISERRLKTEYRHDTTATSKIDLNSKELKFNKPNAVAVKNLYNKSLPSLEKIKSPFKKDKEKKSSYLDFNSFNMLPSTKQSYNANEAYGSSYRKQFEQMLQEEESKKVFVLINSFGGSVGNGITVHDALQFIRAGSFTLALGVAASAASLVLAGGTIGERYVTEGCHVMIHQPEGGLNGQASDIWIDSQEIMKIRLDVAEIYSLSTYRPRHKILRDLDRDFYLNAMETVSYGLADEIATNGVMNDLIDLMNKEWWHNYDSKQQRLLETRESASAAMDTQTQN